MAWIEFTKYLAAAYLLYFGINVIIDLLKLKRDHDVPDDNDILEFSEPFETAIIEEKDYNISAPQIPAVNKKEDKNMTAENQEWLLKGENINVSSGGVTSLSRIVELAQNDTIEFTKKIVY
jgi:hypothetical protein